MKTLTKNFAKKERKIFWKPWILFFLSTILITINAAAQDVKNIKQSLASIKTEQEKLAFDEKMSYVYMFLGLVLVMAIAWFSTVYYTKKSKKVMVESSQNQHRHYIRHPHDPRRRPKVNRARR